MLASDASKAGRNVTVSYFQYVNDVAWSATTTVARFKMFTFSNRENGSAMAHEQEIVYLKLILSNGDEAYSLTW